MRNRFKLAAGGVGVAAVAASVALTGGTSAYFYDLEKSTGNAIEACELDLTYRMSNLTQRSAAPQSQATAVKTSADNVTLNGAEGAFALADLQPGDSYSVQVNVRNNAPRGDGCSGELYMDVDNHLDLENGLTEPERSAGDADESGDLGETVVAKLTQDGSVKHDGSLAAFAEALPRVVDSDFTPQDEHTLVMSFTVPESGVRGGENAIMSDSYSFDLDFGLFQKGYGSTENLG